MPKYLLTSLVYRIARVRNKAIKNFLIKRFVRHYDVDVTELVHPVPDGYPTFNDFFIRPLVAGARDIDAAQDSIVSPVDGTVSAAGRIRRNRLLQAKGLDYTLQDLLATDTAEAERYEDGSYATIYLAPFNYHRVHAPLAGELVAARYVPGTLYSVNESTVFNLPRLFVRNERLVCHLRTPNGPMALILVGALNVGTIHSKWTGAIRPRRRGGVEAIDLRSVQAQLGVTKGELLGWFNMGSTVIMLMPPGSCDDFADLAPRQSVRLGQRIGRLTTSR